MAEIDKIPEDLFENGDFLADCEPADLIYFLLNVGNGDTQLILLPEHAPSQRDCLVVDVASTRKLPDLLAKLSALPENTTRAASLLSGTAAIQLLVATHPHQDHIGGVPDLLDRYGRAVREVWDSAYYHPITQHHEMMAWLEDNPGKARLHPTAGVQRYIGPVRLTALSPAVLLRNRYGTYGVHPNNASISLMIEFPMRRAYATPGAPPGVGRSYVAVDSTQRVLLGADAQTDSWAHVAGDFPFLDPKHSPFYRVLKEQLGEDPLQANVFKVPHHASKHGLNLELIERINPHLSLISCKSGMTGHAFPHAVSVELLREALQPIASGRGRNRDRRKDWELGIHFTSARLENAAKQPLGSVALVLGPTGLKRNLWRLKDEPNELIAHDSLGEALRYIGPMRQR